MEVLPVRYAATAFEGEAWRWSPSSGSGPDLRPLTAAPLRGDDPTQPRHVGACSSPFCRSISASSEAS